MEMFMTSVSVLILLYLLVKQIVGYVQDEKRPDLIKLMIIAALLAETIIIGLAFLSGNPVAGESLFFISLGVSGLFPLTLSIVPKHVSGMIITTLVITEYVYIVYRVSTLFSALPLPSEDAFMYGTVLLPFVVLMLYVVTLSARVADIKSVLRVGSVWNSVCMAVDVIYMSAYLVYTILIYILYNVSGTCMSVPEAFLFMMIMVLQLSLTIRIRTSSLFIIWTSHERRIIESMRLTNSEMNVESPGMEVLYKTIYERVLEYFEESRPYLNSELTINDVVNALYTNKLYISKAICTYTGRNFCQFVNYYRIRYAVECFRKDPAMKIVDVASRSGFNSSVSFSMAFRLFMGQKPSDWFRHERARLSKRLK